jgi:hypothetical protein
VSDKAWETLPALSATNPLLVTIQISENPEPLSQHPLSAQALLSVVNQGGIVDTVADFVLDFSFCHGYIPNKLIELICERIGGHGQFFRDKVDYAHRLNSSIGRNLPYISFSALSRDGHQFGSTSHLKRFTELWDGFISEQLTKSTVTRRDNLRFLAGYPSFGKQISPTHMKNALDVLPPGVHYLVVQRRSMSAGKNPRFRNQVETAFGSLSVKGAGGKSFGFQIGPELPPALVDLVRTGAAYLTRVYVGAAA